MNKRPYIITHHFVSGIQLLQIETDTIISLFTLCHNLTNSTRIGNKLFVIFIRESGKNISENILELVKAELGPIPKSKKALYDAIVAIIAKNNYTIDAKYTYENLLGLHIDKLGLEKENIILTEFDRIKDVTNIKMVPNAYILQKISTKYGWGLKNIIDFTNDRRRHYDLILGDSF